MADFNRDGKPDIATADNGSVSAASVLLNTSRPRITALKPTRGKAGSTVIIKGWGFGRTGGSARVNFGAKAVTKHISWSATTIKVKVPKLAAGKKSVTVKTSGGRSNAKTFRVT